MFDYVVVVVSDDPAVRELELCSLKKSVLLDSIFVPVSESGWNGAAGNGLGTLFAIENASKAIERDLVEEVKRGKSVLIVHTAGEGTRNILTRTCKNKAFVEVPKITILEGVIKQFQDFAVPFRIMVTWGDQFLLFEDSAEEISKCAQNTHVMLFGLKTKLTEEVASKYGIQIVRRTEGEGCELLDFDDTRNYELVKRKLQRQGESEVMVNMGMFAMSGVMAECMLNAFSDELEAKKGKFNSDELWQLEISQEPELGAEADYWLNERANRIRNEIFRAEPLAVIKSFPLSDKTAWRDFGTNESYYEGVMRILDEGDVGRRLREFLGVEISSVKNGCEVLDSVYEDSHFEKGQVKSSVISNSTANHAQLEQACVINSKLNRIRGKNCVVYNVVDHASIEVEDCFLVDVFHPNKGRIRLKMRIGEEKGAKGKWWNARLPGNDFSLSEIAEMMKGVSEDEMVDTKKKFEDVAEILVLVEQPVKIKPFVEDKPWGYELWCASPRNYCEFKMGGAMQKFTLDELTCLFPEKIVGVNVEKFPLIVKIIKADENLSVQVHPDDIYAKKLGDVFGKEEAWHVLESKRGKIYLGFKDFMNAEGFKEAVKSEEFLSSLNSFDAHVGDIYHIPAGVIHALGAGTKVYEASTTSERTFRIYDYGRGRELHLADAMEVLRFDEVGHGKDLKKEEHKHKLLRKGDGFEEYILLEGDRFELRLLKVHGEMKVFTEDKLQVLTCVSGDVTLKSKSSNAELSLTPTDTALVPACVESFEVQGDGKVVCANFER